MILDGWIIGDVPCNGCTLCCRHDAVRLLPGDDPKQYKTEQHDHFPGQLMLAHKPNGDCIYLGEHGCTIYERRPRMCREMDCRLIALRTSFTKARRLNKKGLLREPIWKKGRELLRNWAPDKP